MAIMRRNCSYEYRATSCSIAACESAVGGRLERDRRTRSLGKEGKVRQVTRMHRVLVVLAVGLLALAAPLVALADGGGPTGG
jgi:hypothetical protein